MRRNQRQPREEMLPDGYKQLKYIQSTGTQCINTGIGVHPNIETFIIFNYPQVPHETYNYGVYGKNEKDTLAANFRERSYGNLDFRQGLAFQTPIIAIASNTDYLMEQTKTEFALTNLTDGTRVSKSIPTKAVGDNSKPIYLFCVNCINKLQQFGSFVLKRFWIKIDDLYAWDGIPALRTSDDKPGLYDIVHNQFFVNQGTGEFLYA